MIQNILERIDANSLIVSSDPLDKRLAQMDSTNSDDRMVALQAIEAFIERFIKPAMKSCPPSQTRFGLFDLDAVAKTEVHGLVLNFFDERMNELNRPNDAVLKEALDYIEIDIPIAGDRANFHACWAGNKAFLSIYGLINFLKKPLIEPIVPKIESLSLEQMRVKRLLESELPDKLEYIINSLLEWIEQAQSELLNSN